MKKSLILLPLLAGLTLSGCEINLFGKKIVIRGKDGENQNQNNNNNNNNNNDGGEGNTLYTLEEFQGHKLVKEVKDGGRYYLGVYRHEEDLIRFFNGDYHRDSKGYYPYYLNTVAGTVTGAAEVEVKFVGNDEFALLVHANGEVYDGKYIGVYSASSSYGNNVMSVAAFDSLDQTTYQDPKTQQRYTDFTMKFKFLSTYEGTNCYAPAAMFKYPDVDEEAVPKFLGTGHISEKSKEEGQSDYTSIDSKSYEVALDPEQYDLAHFYEI